MAFQKTDFGKIHYEKVGKGPVSVVLHGGPGLELHSLFEPLKPLGKFRKLYFFDQYGCGEDENDKADADFKKTLDHALAFIDSIGAKDVGLIGHSFGSILALAISQHLTNLREVAFICPIPCSWADAQLMQQHRLPRAEQKHVLEVGRLFKEKTPEAGLKLIKLLTQLDVAHYDASMEIDYRSFDSKLCDQVWYSMEGYDYSLLLEKLPCPSLLLYGAKDFIYPQEISPFRENCSEVMEFTEAGHHPFVEKPEEFLEVFKGFFASV